MGVKRDKNMQKNKKLKVFLLLIIMILILLMVALYSSFGISKLAEFSKVENLKAANATNNYIAISTPQEFMNIANNLSGNYILMNDIDMAGIDYTAIGSYDDPFTGILDGNGYKISNIKGITEKKSSYGSDIGIFACIQGGTVNNLYIENIEILANGGARYVGCLSGRTKGNTNIENVHVVGNNNSITFPNKCLNDRIGGLIGYAEETNINRCFININITINATSNSNNTRCNL